MLVQIFFSDLIISATKNLPWSRFLRPQLEIWSVNHKPATERQRITVYNLSLRSKYECQTNRSSMVTPTSYLPPLLSRPAAHLRDIWENRPVQWLQLTTVWTFQSSIWCRIQLVGILRPWVVLTLDLRWYCYIIGTACATNESQCESVGQNNSIIQ